MKDQTLCPKCGRMYCEGYWGEGVCTADMFFGDEPTAAGDAAASYLRAWYEAHRETWWERRGWRHPARDGPWADNLMLGLMAEIGRIERAAEAERQKNKGERITHEHL